MNRYNLDVHGVYSSKGDAHTSLHQWAGTRSTDVMSRMAGDSTFGRYYCQVHKQDYFCSRGGNLLLRFGCLGEVSPDFTSCIRL